MDEELVSHYQAKVERRAHAAMANTGVLTHPTIKLEDVRQVGWLSIAEQYAAHPEHMYLNRIYWDMVDYIRKNYHIWGSSKGFSPLKRVDKYDVVLGNESSSTAITSFMSVESHEAICEQRLRIDSVYRRATPTERWAIKEYAKPGSTMKAIGEQRNVTESSVKFMLKRAGRHE